MKRWLAVATIVTYLGVLCFGVVSHALGFRQASHPGMYYIVWGYVLVAGPGTRTACTSSARAKV